MRRALSTFPHDLGTREGEKKNLTGIEGDACPALFSVFYSRGAPLNDVPRGGRTAVLILTQTYSIAVCSTALTAR